MRERGGRGRSLRVDHPGRAREPRDQTQAPHDGGLASSHVTMLGREFGAEKVELRAKRDGSSMAWVLTRQLAEIVAEELRASGWVVSMQEPASAD